MKVDRLLRNAASMIPRIVASAGRNPENLSPSDVEKISIQAIDEAIPSIAPGAKAELIGGQKFPDITITLGDEIKGVEIKSTRGASNPWLVTGGSIREGNRIEGVEEVWVMFTRLAGVVEARARPYSDAVCDLAVTHSPRYILSMETPSDQSLFARLGVKYEQVRTSDSPFDFFRGYLAEKARESGGHPWWSESDPDEVSPPLIRFWEDIDKDERHGLLIDGWIRFSTDFLFRAGREKYKAFAIHLVRRHGIICSSLRDLFTAGGQAVVFEEFGRTPKIIKKFHDALPDIKARMASGPDVGAAAWPAWREGILQAASCHRGGVHAPLFGRIFREYP